MGGALVNSMGELKEFGIPVMEGGGGIKQVFFCFIRVSSIPG